MSQAKNISYKKLQKTAYNLYRTVTWYQDRLRTSYVLCFISLTIAAVAAYL